MNEATRAIVARICARNLADEGFPSPQVNLDHLLEFARPLLLYGQSVETRLQFHLALGREIHLLSGFVFHQFQGVGTDPIEAIELARQAELDIADHDRGCHGFLDRHRTAALGPSGYPFGPVAR